MEGPPPYWAGAKTKNLCKALKALRVGGPRSPGKMGGPCPAKAILPKPHTGRMALDGHKPAILGVVSFHFSMVV